MGHAIAGSAPSARAHAFAGKNIEVAAASQNVKGRRRVVFLASGEEGAAAPVEALAERFGFAPVHLGMLTECGALAQAAEQKLGALIFQDLFKESTESDARPSRQDRDHAIA